VSGEFGESGYGRVLLYSSIGKYSSICRATLLAFGHEEFCMKYCDFGGRGGIEIRVVRYCRYP